MIGSAEREKQKLEAARQTEQEIVEMLERAGIISAGTSETSVPRVGAYD